MGEPASAEITALLGRVRDGDACARDALLPLAIDDALSRLELPSARQARIVEMRCLLGLSVAGTAEVLDISERTVHTEWRLARAWLTVQLEAA